MIRVTFSYPAGDVSEGVPATFDHAYYRDTHVPLCISSWGLGGAEIDRGVGGPYLAAVHFRFPDMQAFEAAMASDGTAAVAADVARYTNTAPVAQISEIVE